MRTFYVTRQDGTPLGTLDAEDANVAQSLAVALHGFGAYVFPCEPPSAGSYLGQLRQEVADGEIPGAKWIDTKGKP